MVKKINLGSVDGEDEIILDLSKYAKQAKKHDDSPTKHIVLPYDDVDGLIEVLIDGNFKTGIDIKHYIFVKATLSIGYIKLLLDVNHDTCDLIICENEFAITKETRNKLIQKHFMNDLTGCLDRARHVKRFGDSCVLYGVLPMISETLKDN